MLLRQEKELEILLKMRKEYNMHALQNSEIVITASA